MTQEQSHSLPIGRRERNKLLKRQRIVTAAQALFRVRGYDATTTREIAQAADVASGTLFTYARDKRDLLLMILNDHLETVPADIGNAPRRGSPVEQLVELFRSSYGFFAQERGIALCALREIGMLCMHSDPDYSPEVGRMFDRHHRTRQRVADILTACGFDLSADQMELAVEILTSVQQMNVRYWLAGDPKAPEAGLARLRTHYEVIIAGLRSQGCGPTPSRQKLSNRSHDGQR